MLIDCDNCQVRGPACGDCVVTSLLGMPGRGELDGDERAAIAVLAASGLVPPLRLVPGGRPARAQGPGHGQTSTDRDETVKRRATG